MRIASLCLLIWGMTSLAVANDYPALFQKYCLDCHDSQTKEGGLSLESISGFKDAAPEVWDAIHEKLQLRQMPPKDSEQPSGEDREEMLAWVAGALQSNGHHVSNKLQWPNYGNYVDHEELFRSEPHPAPATSVRIWRKRPEAYAVRNRGGIQAFSMVPGQQISDFSALYTIDESSTEIILRNAQQLIASWTQVELRDGELIKAEGSQTQAVFLPILHPEQEPDVEEFAKAVNWQFHWALEREATEEELQRLKTLYDSVTKEYGRQQAARAVLTVPLLKPESVYRLELGSGEMDEHGRRRLTKAEILSALTHTLFDGNPPHAINVARSKSELSTRAEVAELVQTLLEGNKPNERLLTFFDEYFDYRKAPGVFKEVPSGVDFNAHQLTRDTHMLIEHIVQEDQDVLRRLLTTNLTFISDDSDLPRNHRIYNFPADWKWHEGLIELPQDERAGVLTQPAWLVAHSGNFDNDPVRRGKWVLEHLLGGTVPDLPISVCAVVPEDEEKTLRERFAVIRNNDYCWNCHQQMNPLGMPLENFDHFGRYRLQEKLKPVDTSGAVIGIEDASVDGAVENPLELIRRLAKSKRSQEVFVRYAFRFFLGRNETLRDAKTLQEASQAYEQSGGSMKALVVSLLTSDSFLYRTPAP